MNAQNQPQNAPSQLGLWLCIGLLLIAAGFGVYFWMQYSDATAKLASQEKELALKKFEADSLSTKVKTAEDESYNAQRSLGDLRERVANLEKERDKLTKTVDVKLSGVQKELDACRAAEQDALKRKDAAEKDILALRQELESCAQKIAAAPKSADAPNKTALLTLENELKECRQLLDARPQPTAPEAEPKPDPALLAELGRLKSELDACLGKPLPPAGASKAEIEALEKRAQEAAAAYEKLINNLKKDVADKNVIIEQHKDKVNIAILGQILFNFASITVSDQGRALLDKIAPLLATVKDKKIYIVGHTDATGIAPHFAERFPTNWELSAARASSVLRYLTDKQNVDPARIAAVGQGAARPVAGNDTEPDRARNRRVEIIIAPEL